MSWKAEYQREGRFLRKRDTGECGASDQYVSEKISEMSLRFLICIIEYDKEYQMTNSSLLFKDRFI